MPWPAKQADINPAMLQDIARRVAVATGKAPDQVRAVIDQAVAEHYADK